MRNVIVPLQEGLDLSVPDTSPEQLLIGVVILALLALGLAIARQQASNLGLPEENREHRSAIREDLHEQQARILQHPSSHVAEGIADLEAQLDALFGKRGEETAATTRAAVSDAFGALTEAWGARVAAVPAAVLTAVQWALLVSLFGAIATATGAVVAWLSKSPDYPTLGEFVQDAGREATAVAQTGADIVAAFPYAGFLWDLAFVAVIKTAELLYNHWYALVALLVVSAGVVWYLDRRLAAADIGVPRQLVGHPRLTAASAVVVLAATWATGTVFAVLGDIGGLSGTAATAVDALGFLAALGVFAYLGGKGLRAGVWRVRRGLKRESGEFATVVAASLLIKRLIRLAGGVAGLLVLAYIGVGWSDGSFAAVASAYAGADVGVQATVAIATLLVIGTVGWAVRDAWPDIRAALAPVVSQRSVRARMIVTGMPLLGIAGGYILVWLFTQRIAAAIIGAVVIGLLLRAGGRTFDRAVVATNWKDLLKEAFGRKAGRWTTWQAYVLEDADGREHYLIEVADERLASTSREDAVRAAATVGREASNDEKPSPTLEAEIADALVEQGIVDDDEVRAKVGERTRKIAFATLRKHGPTVKRERWDRRLDELPEDIREERLRDLRTYIRVGDDRVVLRRDPYAGRAETATVPSLSD